MSFSIYLTAISFNIELFFVLIIFQNTDYKCNFNFQERDELPKTILCNVDHLLINSILIKKLIILVDYICTYV